MKITDKTKGVELPDSGDLDRIVKQEMMFHDMPLHRLPTVNMFAAYTCTESDRLNRIIIHAGAALAETAKFVMNAGNTAIRNYIRESLEVFATIREEILAAQGEETYKKTHRESQTATFGLHGEFDKLVNAFNDLMAGGAITCQMEDYSRATVSFAITTRPGFPTDGNPALHMMEEGSVFDIAYWLDNSQMDTRALKLWIKYRETLENSCAGEYLNAPSLEDFHKHPEDIIPANQIERIEHLIAKVHEINNSRDIEIRNVVGTEVKGWLAFRKHQQPNENRAQARGPHNSAGNETTDG